MANEASGRGLVIAAAFVIVIAGMKTASVLLAPVLVALSLIMAMVPVVFTLERRGLSRGLALCVVFLTVGAIATAIALLVGGSATDMIERLPEYEALFEQRQAALFTQLSAWGIDVPKQQSLPEIDPATIALPVLKALGALLGNLFMVLLLVLFGLLEAGRLPAALQATAGPTAVDRIEKMRASVARYMVFKLIAGLIQGTLIAVWLWFLGVENAVLWGFLGGLLNFVPQVGGVVAAALPGILTLLTDGLPLALAVGVGIGVVTTLVENFLQPKLFNRALGLSMVMIVVSVFFWGWVLGPVTGMFLAVPLTIAIKQVLEESESTRWLAAILGTVSEPEPKKG